jgi:ADP-ribosylglycohydrolase
MSSRVNQESLSRARISLLGLSVGDAFGDTFFIKSEILDTLLEQRGIAAPPWPYTDDTNMALSIVESLRRQDSIVQTALAQSFARHFDRTRKYGAAMVDIFQQVREGADCMKLARQLFDGQGSYGNGAAMRVAPLGAYFADDLAMVVQQAQYSAEVTHLHPDGIAGAIAVAVAAALAWQWKVSERAPDFASFLQEALNYIPPGNVKEGIRLAQSIGPNLPARMAASVLGNGSQVSAQDTVPFCLWCAAKWLDNYEEALWQTVSGLGDRDTTCAIVGGIVAVYSGEENIPTEWLSSREPLPDWPFRDE